VVACCVLYTYLFGFIVLCFVVYFSCVIYFFLVSIIPLAYDVLPKRPTLHPWHSG